MTSFKVLVVAGTHGNEINAPWLIRRWEQEPDLIKTNGIKYFSVIGNPEAYRTGRRYISRDLNRTFEPALLSSPNPIEYEVIRAKQLLSAYGPAGRDPCNLVLDLHSTTAAMGSCLVVYGRRPADLAFAALIQSQLGLPIYLHESDDLEHGFLVEAWPCGLVIEIGAVAQSLLHPKIVAQTKLVLQACFDQISKVVLGIAKFPNHLVIHRHLGSLDFPRDEDSQPEACLHPDLIGKDWIPLKKHQSLFVDSKKNIFRFKGEDLTVPVFINEAAYAEKNIAMSLTKREVWCFSSKWKEAIEGCKHN